MLISNSFWRRIVATVGAAVGLALLFETTTRDSRYAARDAVYADATPVSTGAILQFQATAYCKGETTASGARVRTGIAAADPLLLPVGSVVRVETPDPRYTGIWTVMDTGPAVQGRTLDLYMWSCYEALEFGRRPVRVSVLRMGWHPGNSTPDIVDSLFQDREDARNANPPPKWVRPAPASATPAEATDTSVTPAVLPVRPPGEVKPPDEGGRGVEGERPDAAVPPASR